MLERFISNRAESTFRPRLRIFAGMLFGPPVLVDAREPIREDFSFVVVRLKKILWFELRQLRQYGKSHLD